MASGNITGRINVPVSPITYTGEETDTAETVVNNEDKTIAVNVKPMETGTKLYLHTLKVGSEVRAVLISTVSRELVSNTSQGVMYGFVMSDSEAKRTIVTYIKATSDTLANTIGKLQQTFSNSYGVFKFTGISNGSLQFENVIPYTDAANFTDTVVEL